MAFHRYSVIDKINFVSSPRNSGTQMIQNLDVLETKEATAQVLHQTIVDVEFAILAVHKHLRSPLKMVDAVKFNVHVVRGGSHSFWPLFVTDMRIQIDPLGYTSQVIQACSLWPFGFPAVEYFLTHTTAMPNLNGCVHVDKLFVIKKAVDRKYGFVMSFQMRELLWRESTTSFHGEKRVSRPLILIALGRKGLLLRPLPRGNYAKFAREIEELVLVHDYREICGPVYSRLDCAHENAAKPLLDKLASPLTRVIPQGIARSNMQNPRYGRRVPNASTREPCICTQEAASDAVDGKCCKTR